MELKKRLLAGAEPLLGAFLGVPSPALTEMIGLAGFDFAILDAEHGAFDRARMEECLRAAAAVGLSCVVRVGELNAHAVQTALDLGAEGIQVPQVESEEEARKTVEFSHFPPIGTRGYGSTTRAANYGFLARNRVIADAGEKTVVCVQIESRAGVENMRAIVETPGVDVVFIGTSDLSLAYGLESPADPKVNALVDELVPAIRKAGKVAGIYSSDRSRQDHLVGIGVRYFTIAAGILAKEAFRQETRSFAELNAKSLTESAARSSWPE